MALIHNSNAFAIQAFIKRLESMLPPGTIVHYSREFDSGDLQITTETGRFWVFPMEFMEQGAVSEADWFVAEQSPDVLGSLDEMIASKSLNWHAQYMKPAPPSPVPTVLKAAEKVIAEHLGMTIEQYRKMNQP